MKAYRVVCSDEWMTLMHADSRGKAIQAARNNVDGGEDFLSFRAYREPELDDKSFSWKNILAAGVEYKDEYDNPLSCEDYWNDCGCEICKQEG